MHSTLVKKTVIILLSILITGCSAIPLDLSFLNTATPAPTATLQPTVTDDQDMAQIVSAISKIQRNAGSLL